MNPEIRVQPDLEGISLAAADLIGLAMARSMERFTLALAGGGTPKRLYEILAERAEELPWERVHILFGDERCVPPDHPDSNYRMAHSILLARAKVSPDRIHRVPGERNSPERAAREYEETLRRLFPDEKVPTVDLILLGIGSDGHTASLFPGDPALDERSRWVVPVAESPTPPFVPRITLTLPVLNAAQTILFLVSGEEKRAIVQSAIERREKSDPSIPASLIQPRRGRVIWLVDDAANPQPPNE